MGIRGFWLGAIHVRMLWRMGVRAEARDLHRRAYRDPSDIDRIRAMLRAAFALDGAPGGNWHVADFDYWRWHWLENVVERGPEDLLLWETADGEIAAVALQGDPGVVHFRIHPSYRTAALEEEMIVAAEAQYAAPGRDGAGRVLAIWTDERDAIRQDLLRRRGFETYQSDHVKEHNRRIDLTGPIAAPSVPTGYRLRTMGGEEDLPARSLASWRAFHPDEPDDEADRAGDWYRSVQRAPLYRNDFDIVAVDSAGELVSFSLGYYDAVSRTAVLVLAGTATAHQRRGLGKAVVTEMLRRLRDAGAKAARVSSYEAPAHALYESSGFTDCAVAQAWRKRIPG